jgi:hypothetical protein
MQPAAKVNREIMIVPFQAVAASVPTLFRLSACSRPPAQESAAADAAQFG